MLTLCLGMQVMFCHLKKVRHFGGYFEHVKENLLAWEIERAGKHPRRWEKKGSTLLTTANINAYGSEILPVGPVSQTHETSQAREEHCLIQAITRLLVLGGAM